MRYLALLFILFVVASSCKKEQQQPVQSSVDGTYTGTFKLDHQWSHPQQSGASLSGDSTTYTSETYKITLLGNNQLKVEGVRMGARIFTYDAAANNASYYDQDVATIKCNFTSPDSLYISGHDGTHNSTGAGFDSYTYSFAGKK